MTVTFKSMMDKVGDVENYLLVQNDVAEARKKARELYKMGLEMVEGELSGRPLIKDDEESVLPILNRIHEIIIRPGYQDFVALNRTLSKVLRIFVELRWYQPWRTNESMPLFTELRDQFINTASTMNAILKKRKDSMGARFELRCARQGARMLTPAKPLWQTYMRCIFDLIGAGGDLSTGGTSAAWEALKNLAAELRKDNPIGKYTWYPDVHSLRWESGRVKTMDLFDATIDSKIDLCHRVGGNYSNSLALIFMHIIKNSSDAKLQERAFKGMSGRAGLIDLIRWESPNTWKDLSEHPIEKLSSKFGRADRFWETRQIALRLLMKLATKDKYREFHAESREALRIRSEEIKTKDAWKYDQDKEEMRRKIEDCKNRGVEISKDLKRTGAKLNQARKGRGDQEHVEKLEQEKASITMKQDAIASEATKLSSGINHIEMVEQIFAQKLDEEQNDIDKFLSSGVLPE